MIVLASLVLGSMLAGRVPAPPVVKPEPLAREMVTNFNAGRFKAATKDFSDDLAALATPAALAEQKKSLDLRAGAFRKVATVQQYRDAGFPVIYLLCTYEKTSVAFRVTFDYTNHITMVYIDPVVKVAVDPALEATSRAFVADFAAGKYADATKAFDQSLRGQLKTETLAEVAKTITSRFGEWQSITEIDQTTVDGLRTLTILNQYEKSPIEVRLTFTAGGTIAGMKIGPKAD
jgi:hypothetical protein